MRLRASIWVVAAVMCAIRVEPTFAKRRAPKVVETDHADRIYRANDLTADGTDQAAGIVEVFDRHGDKRLWSVRVYCIEKNPGLEQDVQDVFVARLEVRGKTLIVTDELGDIFEVNLPTRKVSMKRSAASAGGLPRVRLCEP
jgi:hypothetical protein